MAHRPPLPLSQETTAWALGQVFEQVHGAEAEGAAPIVSKEMLPGLLTALVESLKDEPRVAYYVCDAIRLLALGFNTGDGGLGTWVEGAGGSGAAKECAARACGSVRRSP